MPTSEGEEILHKLLERRLNRWMVKPDYDRYGLSNLVSSVLECFDVKDLKCNPIPEQSVERSLDGVENVILLLVDGLSYYLNKDLVERYLRSLRFSTIPVSSTFPSTTTTALTTLNTGLTPQEHAVIGYTMYLKEVGVVLSLTNFAPSAAPESDSLIQAGLDPSAFLDAETIHSRLRRRGVRPVIMTRRIYRESPLTTMLGSGADLETYAGVADIFVRIRKLLEQTSVATFLFTYWDGLDIAAHVYGPESEEAEAELQSLIHSLKSSLLEKIQPNLAKKTALLILGDHGQHTLHPSEVLRVEKHPTLLDSLHIPPTGDSRAACLYPKPEMRDRLVEYVETHLSEAFSIYEAKYLLKEGLFGLGESRRNLLDRTGDLILLPKESGAVAYSYRLKHKEFDLRGGHGGLHPKELITLLVCGRLG